MTQRFLVKLRDGGAGGLAGFQPRLAGANFQLKPLFSAPAAPSGGLGAAPADPATWYLAVPADTQSFGAAQTQLAGLGDWEAAHRFVKDALGDRSGDVLAFEPDIVQEWLPANQFESEPGEPLAAANRCANPELADGRFTSGREAGWHLGEKFTGLKQARERVGEDGESVTIAHLDTGFDPGHVTLPRNLDLARQRNFWDEDPDKAGDARDPGAEGLFNNPGHGPGTLGILAGGILGDDVLPEAARTGDFLGGAPFARIIPMRIANSVVHFSTSTVAAAINAARKEKVDIVSMSMGGYPSQAWADAVNRAYEAGVTIVCAAGNTFGNPPTSIVYPARFERVLAACGIMANGEPYDDLPPFVMRGCSGPQSKMDTALSAYTPNIPWARLGCAKVVDLNGAGTSSATPQIAAAAALWIAHHGRPHAGSWARVEAVRRALFKGARRPNGEEVDSSLGMGVLNAFEALKIPPAAMAQLRKTPPDNADFAFLKLLFGQGVAAEDQQQQALELEFAQLYFRVKDAEKILPDPHAGPQAIPEGSRRRLMEAILDAKLASTRLEMLLKDATGRTIRPTAGGAPQAFAAAPDQPTPPPSIQGAPVRPRPKARRLAIYSSDPSVSNRLHTRDISTCVVSVRWEATRDNGNLLLPGPVGDYVEVVDVDHASNMIYDPVNLNDPYLLASDGLTPSVGDPQFHQQMVYAVAMRTIANFERALGRPVLWATKRIPRPKPEEVEGPDFEERYVGRLRIYPHALRQRNAYYSPDRVALLFGYFPNKAYMEAGEASPMTFTCLSHDIVAHEVCHAILDGLHRRYQEATNPDVLAFHEGFADIVAIFQHFTFKDMLTAQIQSSGPDLRKGKLLVELAAEFGMASGYGEALRSALDKPDRTLANTKEPHDRGAILVAAVFDAFRSVFDHQVADLMRLASGGTGVMPTGALPPDLVARLAREAAKIAEDFLTICIRALDYCPPVDITFGDYLRALITADTDVVGDDRRGYRVALLEAFAARGIYPRGMRALSVDSLRWRAPEWQPPGFAAFLRTLALEWKLGCNRQEAFTASKRSAARLHKWLARVLNEENAYHFGLNLAPRDGEAPKFEVHSVRPAARVLDDGSVRKELIIVITQKEKIPDPSAQGLAMRGGATLIVDIGSDTAPIRYAVIKKINGEAARKAFAEFQASRTSSAYEVYFGGQSGGTKEPFAFLHSQCGCAQ